MVRAIFMGEEEETPIKAEENCYILYYAIMVLFLYSTK